MRLTSKAFENLNNMPVRYTGFGEDVSPELQIEDIPEETVSMAIIMDDLDVPVVNTFTHWIAWNIPPVSKIPEAIPRGEQITEPIPMVQGVAWGKHVYRGPKQPPFLRKPHRYRFTVYALSSMLDIPVSSNKAQLKEGIDRYLLEQAELSMTFCPK